jgi:hypothetical protein
MSTSVEEAPVEVPNALGLQLLAGDGVGRAEMTQQAQRAVSRNLPDAKEAEDVVDAVGVKIPAKHILRDAGTPQCSHRCLTHHEFHPV